MKNIVFVFLAFMFLGCPDKPCTTCPPPATNCDYPAGNRSFTWRLDTVAWWPSTVAGVWAFSDTDAYVIGTIIDGTPPYQSRQGRHWNGKIWENDIHGSFGSDITVVARNDVTGDDHLLVAVGFHAVPGIEYAGVAEFDNNAKKWKSYQLQAVGELRSVWTDGKGYFMAVGDSGMVYTKDGYSPGWVYQKAPTDFSFYKLAGVSKKEIYIVGYNNLVTGESYDQIWKYDGELWIKLFDTQDSTQQILPITNEEYVGDVFPFRCSITDSLTIYVIGQDSYRLQAKGQQLEFSKIDLAILGLPLKQNGRTGVDINAYSPNDVWIFGTRYNFYHWNGADFQKMVLPGLPDDDTHFGRQQKMIKTSSGKLFLPTEVSSQLYVVVQGTP